MGKGKFKVAIVQNLSRASLSDVPSVEFTREILDSRLDKDVQSFESNDVNEMVNWVMHNAKTKKIYRYALALNSSYTRDFINVVAEKKLSSRKANCILNKCIFSNGNSNADSVRELNILKNTQIYFTLSRLSTVLKNIEGVPPNKIMLVVSDYDTPYYAQIYAVDISPKYKVVNELTYEKINEFVDAGGYKIVTALGTQSEYQKVVSEVYKSRFEGEMCAIEIDYPEEYVFENPNIITTTISSGVSICGDIGNSPGLNRYLNYGNAILRVMYNCKSWPKLIKSNILSVGKSLLPDGSKTTFSTGGFGTGTVKVPG